MKPVRDITFEFIKDGYQVIHKYGKSSNIYCFDYLGIEQKKSGILETNATPWPKSC